MDSSIKDSNIIAKLLLKGCFCSNCAAIKVSYLSEHICALNAPGIYLNEISDVCKNYLPEFKVVWK